MKKSLKKLHALVIAFAVVFSFSISAVHSYSDNVGDHTMGPILADQASTASALQGIDCDGNEDHCDIDSSQHTHISECCPLTFQAPLLGQMGTMDTPWSEIAKNLIELSSGPLLRPPRFSA